MYPAPIEHYHAPGALTEALQLIAAAPAAILAGGQSLMPQLKARQLTPRSIVDINRIAGLDGVVSDAEGVTVGALVRLAHGAAAPQLRGPAVALAEACAAVGDRQVRNRATLAGSIVFGANYGDIAPAAAVLDASVIIDNAAAATRRVRVDDFVRGCGRCDLRAGDLVTALHLPALAPRSASCYLKHGRVAQDRAVLGVAAWLELDDDGCCRDLRIALAGLASHPIVRVGAAETHLAGRRLSAALIDESGALAAASVATQSDELASADYRIQLLRVCVPQALMTAWTRATEAP